MRVLVCLLPLTDETRGILNREALMQAGGLPDQRGARRAGGEDDLRKCWKAICRRNAGQA